jgi:hypothetical protein
MKYSVVYLKPKKKGQFSKQSVVFLDVESAFFWKNVVEYQGCKQVEVSTRILICSHNHF